MVLTGYSRCCGSQTWGPTSPPLNELAGVQFAAGEARRVAVVRPYAFSKAGVTLAERACSGLRRASADVPLNRLFIDGLGEPRFPRPIAQIPVTQIKRHPVVAEVTINRGRQELLVLVSPFIAPDEPSLNPHRASPLVGRWKTLTGCTRFQTRCDGENGFGRVGSTK